MGSNWNRPCLNLEASDIPSDYTHVHFGFANLTEDFDVVISDDQLFQWEIFLGMTTYKRIVSIGGWAFSTDPSTYHIFREGTTDDNRATLIANVVAFVNDVSPLPLS
jgi:chitinase